MSEKNESKPIRSDLDEAALFFHKYPRPGKLEIQATKPLGNQRDLALAYSPGVAAPCLAIRDEPALAADYTSRANLVGVVSNGTAVLGLGDIGPLASKPVMEGKAVLFKKFAGIDVFDLEVAETDIDRFVEVVAALEPTFGGVNLEDIKAPECFIIEKRLRERMNIPVFHDDQHGTAIVCAAAIRNGLLLQDKALEGIKLVTSGAGAAALAGILSASFNEAAEAALASALSGSAARLHRFDVASLARQVAEDPASRGFRDVVTPCKGERDCGGHLFWDGIHPTTQAHARLAEAALAELGRA